MSNHQSTETFVWSSSTHQFSGGDFDSDRTSDGTTWYPRVLSSYGLTERLPWSRHLNVDASHRSGQLPAIDARSTRLGQQATADRDHYGSEDVDAAFLRRKPVSFVIFGKPGLEDDRLAAVLSAYWGCIHVSAANGLLAASGRPDDPIGLALRHGGAVNAAGTAALLVDILGIGGAEVRERGYVLTGLPRQDPELSARAQMSAVFATNSPDVLIYMRCRNQDLSHMHNGLTLESMEHGGPTQTLHLNDAGSNHRRVRWYHHKAFGNKNMVEKDLKDYECHSLQVIDQIVKQFDATRVITVDGRKPVSELFEMIRAKLMTMSLQRTVLPEIVPYQDESFSILDEQGEFELEYESESNDADGNVELANHTTRHNGDYVHRHNEQIRVTSEFGRLCPVSFSEGRFELGSDLYCIKFMGKSYYFVGPDEMQSFGKCPRRFLQVPRHGLPVRAMLYGPRALTNPAAKAIHNFFGYNLIDVEYITQLHEQRVRQAYSSAIVGAILKTAKEVLRPKQVRPDDVEIMRNAIADWTRLRFGIAIRSDLRGEEDGGGEYEINDDFSDQEKQNQEESYRLKQLTRLKNYFESYDMDFIDELEACIRIYDEPETQSKYFQNMSKKNRNLFRSNLIQNIKIVQLEIKNVIVDTVRIRNKQYKNWVIVNAPLDFTFVKNLIDEDLNPIQMVFFHDTDPMHSFLLLNNEVPDIYQNTYKEVYKNVKNGMRYGTTVERIKYPEFVNKIENPLDISSYEEHFVETEFEPADYEETEQVNNITHEYLMEIIVPEITERLNQYTANLLVQWNNLINHISKETDQFIDFRIIICEPNSATNVLKIVIEETLYHIKKFLTDNVYNLSAPDINDTVPTIGKYNGDTSIYCPVRFANGKLCIGSKKHMAVYHNRYYYMSSSNDLKAFVSNPNRYALFTSIPKMYPKPKISLLFSFGLSSTQFINELLDTFNLTLVDSYKVFKQNVLPSDMPMMGKMFEEPSLKKIVDKYFIPENQNDYINSLRKYMDKESDYLNDEDWLKMNSIFFQANEGICYKNYPKSLTELKYLKENEINPDVIIEVLAENNVANKHAKKSVIQNWLTYQYALFAKVIARDKERRQNSVNKRSILFKQKIAEVIKQKEINSVKQRLERIIREMVAETTAKGPDAVKSMCHGKDQPSDKSYHTCTLSSVSDLLSRYSELTLKQKKIIINHGLSVSDLSRMDDFTTLDEIDETVNAEVPEDQYTMGECFSNGFESPPDAMIERYLSSEKTAMAAMRQYAEMSGIPWKTVSGPTTDFLKSVLPQDDDVAGERGAFETTYDVDPETAEDMLCAGEVHLSNQFGRWCPVKQFGSTQTRFHPDLAENGRVQPMVHRKYVYYVSEENRNEFARRPLRYAALGSVTEPPPPSFPLKIAVVGPPGSGKSRCARELCDRYGLQLIRVEDAVDAYTTAYRWTDLAKVAIGTLRRGGALSEEALAEAVTTAAFGGQAVVRGFVIDGYPVTEHQFKLLDGAGFMLHAVFVLNGRRPEGNGGRAAALSRFRLDAWDAVFVGLPWISARYGNATGCAATDTGRMSTALSACVRSMLAYRTDVRHGRPARLAGVPVTGHEFRYGLSTFLDRCPVCRVDDGRLVRPHMPASMRQFAVQYRQYIYWTCGPDHEATFVGHPDRYAGAAPTTPDMYPVATTDVRLSLNPLFRHEQLSEMCVVCALSCLWDPVYKCGRPDLMVAYGHRTFAFCSSRCLKAFSQQPSLYAEYEMCVAGPERQSSPPPWDAAQLDGLPVLGYLEQTVAARLSSAVAALTTVKPVYPGLSATVSAMVYLGLYVGMNNGGGDEHVVEYYRDAFKRFVDACHSFKIEAFKLKSMT